MTSEACPPAGPAVALSRTQVRFLCRPGGLERGLVSLPCLSCSRHFFGFSSPAICLLNRTILKLFFFFSGCSHTPAFNPLRLKLCIGKSRRKIDDGQTDAILKAFQRLPTSRGLQLSHPHKVHGGTNPSCSPCLSLPTASPCFRQEGEKGWGTDQGMISGDCPGWEVTVMVVVAQKSQSICIAENLHFWGISDE